MRKFIAVLLLAFTMAACSGSRGCGCPNWGKVDTDQNKLMVQENRMPAPDGWVWM
ncbi:MAG: hypothetical protein KDD32_05250 [Bacteroidetes bacterium]|nr:hypothetical protein [Bacteroidota bacterium]